jgi:hypothetical protein
VRAHEQSLQEASRVAELFNAVRSARPGVNGQALVLRQRVIEAERKMMALTKLFYTYGTGIGKADSGKYLGLVADREAQFEIVKALWGDTNVSPEARQFADNLSKMLDHIADTYQRHGLSLNKMEDYRTPQPQDPAKLAGDGMMEVWVKKHLNYVDRSQYFNADGTLMNDNQLTRFLEEAYQTLLTDGANKRAEGDRLTGGSMLVGANKNKPRRLFYKDAKSWDAAMREFGRSSNLYEIIASHVHGMAKDIALAQTFGRNAERNFRRALAIAVDNDIRASKGTRDHERITALASNVNRLFEAYTRPEPLVDPRLAKWGDNIRAFISSTALGNGPTAAFSDVGIMRQYMRLYNLPVMEAFRSNVKNMIPDQDRQEFLQKLGLWNEGFQQAHNRVLEESYASNWGHLLAAGTQKLMAQNAWDRGMVSGFGMVVQNTIGKLTRKYASLADVGEDGKILRNLGVTDSIYDIWKLTDLVEGYGADSLLSPQAIYDIPDAKLEPIVEQRVAARSAALKAEIEKRNAQTEREKGWLENRMKKFNEARDKAYKWLREFDERRQKMVGEAADMAAANAELMRARLERAEVEHDIAGYLKTETSQARIKRFLERVEDGANVERQGNEKTPAIGERATKAVEDYGRSINDAGERLGQRRARTEARIEAAEKRLTEISKKADAEVQRKADALDKRFGATLKDIEDAAKEYQARAAKRAEYAAAFEAKAGMVLGEEMMKAKDEAAVKLMEVVHHHTRRALRGSSAASTEDRVALGLDKNPRGTILGELWRFALQFKSVPIGIFRTQLEVAGEQGSVMAKGAYMAKYVAHATLPAVLGLQIRALLGGQDPNDMDPTTEEGQMFWVRALATGGGFGIWGDLASGGYQTAYGRGPLETLAGPGITIGTDLIHTAVFGGPAFLMDAADGETERNYGLEALQFARRNAIPFANIWYVKGAFNRLVYDQMQEMLEPGTVDKHIQRMENKGASYYWRPGQPLPDRAPDFSKAYEE